MANVLSVAGSNSKYKIEGAIPAGFLGGLWHGMIAPITLIVSMFNENVRIYETNNNGRLYDLDFLHRCRYSYRKQCSCKNFPLWLTTN